MKQILITLSFAILSLAVACKSGNDPTPATSSIVGEYALTGNETFITNGQSKVSTIGATLFVMQTSTANRYYFLERYGTQDVGYFVNMNGQNLEMEDVLEQTFPDSNRWVGWRKGSGKADSGIITYQTETPTFSIVNLGTGLPFGSSIQTSINSMSRKVSFNAKKK